FSLLISSVALCNLQAQSYQQAIGLRLGVPVSASYKFFLEGTNNAIEGFVSYDQAKFQGSGWSWISIGGGYQIHNDLSSVTDGLQWYYGAGAAMFLWTFDSDFSVVADQASLSVGLLGFIGLDYKIPNAPVNVSADWVPTLFLNGFDSGFGAGYGAIAVRYILKE
ncbi:MAG: hypothetical protein AAFY48_13830, partial [Bacteroidota bacterium]